MAEVGLGVRIAERLLQGQGRRRQRREAEQGAEYSDSRQIQAAIVGNYHGCSEDFSKQK
jgi:hypothetical protein